MNYEDRVVAYIDILAFRDTIKKTVTAEDDVPSEIDKIVEMYQVIRDAWFLDEERKPFKVKVMRGGKESYETFEPIKDENPMGKMVTMFSDTIVVSFLASTESAVFRTLLEIRWLIFNLANRGVLCRGAIAHGKLIHDEKMVFGPALVSAYTMESKAALYPRVILDEEILRVASMYHASHHDTMDELKYIYELLEVDSDGMYFINYIGSLEEDFDNWVVEYPRYLSKIFNIIEDGINHPSPDIKIKYMWLRERYNEVVSNMNMDKLVEELSKEGREEEAKAFASIKKHESY